MPKPPPEPPPRLPPPVDPSSGDGHATVATVVRTEGQRMLLCVTGSLEALAGEIGVKSRQSIADWKAGTKIPNPSARARIHAALGIPAHAWSVMPGTDLTGRPDLAAPVDAASSPSTLDDCLALLAVIRRDRMQPGLVAGERVKLADAEARILALRARLEQAAELSETRYVRDHPAWQRLHVLLVEALEPHPAAAQAVADAIARAFKGGARS